jgi:hypothetical protein
MSNNKKRDIELFIVDIFVAKCLTKINDIKVGLKIAI